MSEVHPGDTFGDYRLEQRLGGGGFGSVWRAVPLAGGEPVALKILNGRFSSGDTMRLRAEVELLAASASSASPHVVRVLGGGVEPVPYVVMEYVEGTDLARELDRRDRLAPPSAFSQHEVIGIARAVASALGVLEAAGIIHRDVKPANVLIDRDGVVKLADFGIAKIVGFDSVTATSQLPMSMAYAAPEVWEGHANHQSDVYALGCMLYQCLVGRPPFAGSYADVFRQHLSAQPDLSALPSDLAPSLRELIRLCLGKQPAERPAGSAAVIALLDRAEEESAKRSSDPVHVPSHEPQGFGPWLREAPHPTQPWAFLCRHETTGQRATVEIHFSDDLKHGSRLRKAVAANPALVPLGAERLLGTNRLILRPGERWGETPPGAFQFWVAREELPLRPGPAVVTRDLLGRLAAQLLTLRDTAREHGLELALPATDLVLIGDGEVLLRRPGLADGGDDGLEWLRTLPLDATAASALADGVAIAALVRPVEHQPVFGLAATADSVFANRSETAESGLFQPTFSQVVRLPVPMPDALGTRQAIPPLSAAIGGQATPSLARGAGFHPRPSAHSARRSSPRRAGLFVKLFWPYLLPVCLFLLVVGAALRNSNLGGVEVILLAIGFIVMYPALTSLFVLLGRVVFGRRKADSGRSQVS